MSYFWISNRIWRSLLYNTANIRQCLEINPSANGDCSVIMLLELTIHMRVLLSGETQSISLAEDSLHCMLFLSFLLSMESSNEDTLAFTQGSLWCGWRLVLLLGWKGFTSPVDFSYKRVHGPQCVLKKLCRTPGGKKTYLSLKRHTEYLWLSWNHGCNCFVFSSCLLSSLLWIPACLCFVKMGRLV